MPRKLLPPTKKGYVLNMRGKGAFAHYLMTASINACNCNNGYGLVCQPCQMDGHPDNLEQNPLMWDPDSVTMGQAAPVAPAFRLEPLPAGLEELYIKAGAPYPPGIVRSMDGHLWQQVFESAEAQPAKKEVDYLAINREFSKQ